MTWRTVPARDSDRLVAVTDGTTMLYVTGVFDDQEHKDLEVKRVADLLNNGELAEKHL